jgi:DNA-binding CsgD family transcriptional regulator
MRLSEEEVVAFLRREQKAPAAEKFNLTKKEKEVMSHVVRGSTNKKIAEIMKISPGTVNSHLDRIYFKLGCSGRQEACSIALQHGLFVTTSENISRK